MMSLLGTENQSTFGLEFALGCDAVYCDFSRKNLLPTIVGTVTEIWPALVTAGCATSDQEFGSERSVLS